MSYLERHLIIDMKVEVYLKFILFCLNLARFARAPKIFFQMPKFLNRLFN